MLEAIDSITTGASTWSSYTVYASDLADELDPWRSEKYTAHFRDIKEILHEMMGNPSFADQIDIAPFREYDETGSRVYTNFMSGDYAWREAVSTLFSFEVKSTI